MITSSNIEEAKKLINKEKKPIAVQAHDEKFNRSIIEYGKFSYLIINLSKCSHDTPRQLDIGLSSISARIAAKNNISLAIDLNDIRHLKGAQQSKVLSRLASLIKVCRDSSASLNLLNARDKYGAHALLLALGASTQQAYRLINNSTINK